MALSSSQSTFRNLVALVMVLQLMVVHTLATRPGPRHSRALLAPGSILTEYMGASGKPILFTDIPLNTGASYIFPLSFAIDADAAGIHANGVFKPYWSADLTPEAAKAFVQANPNVRLSVSLGGASQYNPNGAAFPVNWYDPPDTNVWIANAVSSITALAKQYSLTGIDIDYETFPTGSATFTACIGGLISQLRSAGTISVASIAPFGEAGLTIYKDLFQNFGSSIDYVNWQFYADDLTTQAAYITRFNEIATTFGASKLLASTSTDVDNHGLQGTEFIGAVQQLSTAAGIMIWDADHDKDKKFTMTKSAATFLTST